MSTMQSRDYDALATKLYLNSVSVVHTHSHVPTNTSYTATEAMRTVRAEAAYTALQRR